MVSSRKRKTGGGRGRWILLVECQSRNRALCFSGFWRKRRGGKYVEEGVGGAATSFSSFPFRSTTSFSSSCCCCCCCCVTSPSSLQSRKDAAVVRKGLCGSPRPLVPVIICLSLCSIFLSFSSSVLVLLSFSLRLCLKAAC